ncbi:MAG: thermopsin, partial [Thermoplasmata archaeon]|nr:thermopsin [Thermoplasmata archaeon]
NMTIDSNSIAGTLTVNASSNFYPNSATPTLWGAQLNAVLANVTILGSTGNFFWVQNVISYNSANDSLSFVDDTWNFTTFSSEMLPSSLASWSPTGGDYTGTWVAFSPSFYAPPPFTVTVYVNSSVNPAGDQVLWYNYSLNANGHYYADGTYDHLVFNSQAPGYPQSLAPAPFEASGTQSALVTEGYEFDAFIGADDGSNNLVLSANATEQLRYCDQPPSNDCSPTRFAYANVPAAVNFGSQTGESTVGVAVNYVNETAYLSGGPLLARGLWNYTALDGGIPGNTRVDNGISVSNSPLVLTSQPYFFVFFTNPALSNQGVGWAPDVPSWYLSPGLWDYQVMLSDYAEATGAIVVGSTPITLAPTLVYSLASGVYTPLWAFSDGQLAGISSSGDGTEVAQYVLFNNPTASCSACGGAANANLSSVFFSPNDYAYESFAGLFLDGTSDYVDVYAPPTFCVFSNGTADFYLNLQFYRTSHATLAHASAIGGWPAQQEIGFYATVPASQNPAPQGDVYLWDSTNDLIMSNTFVAAVPGPYLVSPDQLVLYGGTGNTIWGNTFRNPPGLPLGSSYAGIGEAESGDLIYNNNFSIDNPVVYLPYNFPNVADCLPQSLGACANNETGNPFFYDLSSDTWNVPVQAAAHAVHTVNGFALSGNVLGSFYPTQGGNYYWNYGASPNNYTTSPYVSRFLYTDWSILFPLGCPSNQTPGGPCGTEPPVVGSYQNGMHGSGDFAPLLLAWEFQETGLPAGTAWGATLGALTNSSSGPNVLFSSLETGAYSFSIGNISGYAASPRTGTIDLTGPVATPMTISFTRLPSLPVTFSAAGLPNGATWYVNLSENGTSGARLSAQGPTLATYETAGDYAYTVASSDKSATAPGGSFQVRNSAVNLSVLFTAVTYNVTFTETGLTAGTTWSVTLNGWAGSSLQPSLVFAESNGTYSFSLATVPGYTVAVTGYALVQGEATLPVKGAALGISVTFTPVSSPATFLGLPGAEGYGLVLGVAAAIAVGVLLGTWLRRRRGKAPSAAPRPPP